MSEAIEWLKTDGTVAVYCEGIHLTGAPQDAKTAHRKRRGFEVKCGTTSIYVTAILVAVINGACKNLGADMKCNIYQTRPLVCRIYPAEISPFVQLDPANKVCPPEAWSEIENPENAFAKELAPLAEQSRLTDYREAERKSLVCQELGIQTTGLADEGYVRHFPEPRLFLAALQRAWAAELNSLRSDTRWTLYSASLMGSPSQAGLEVISETPADAEYQFLRF